MSDLAKRSSSAVVFVLLILGPLFIPETRYAFGLYSVLGFFTLRELLRMTHKNGQRFHWSYLSYVILTLFAYSIFFGLEVPNSMFVLGLVATGLAISIQELFQTGDAPFQNVLRKFGLQFSFHCPFLAYSISCPIERICPLFTSQFQFSP